jgi:hypothetical protein
MQSNIMRRKIEYFQDEYTKHNNRVKDQRKNARYKW